MEALVIVLLVALVILAAWYAWHSKKKRRQELARMAAQLGLEFSVQDPFGLLGMPFQLLSRGDGRGCENVLSGTWQGMDLEEFDYWYYEERTDSNGRTSRTYHRFSCVVTEIPADCPPLSISKESFFTRMADRLGFRDIEFESEEFNRAFQVKGRDRKFANDLIDQRMMRWLLGAGEGWSFEASGPFVLCFTGRMRPSELIPLLGTLRGFVENVPRVVYSLYGTGEPSSEPGP